MNTDITKKPIKSVWIFLLWYVLMLIAFIIIGGGVAAIFWEQVLLEAWALWWPWLYIFFGIQQILTLFVLRWALEEGNRNWLDTVIQYLNDRMQRKGRWLFRKRVVGWFLFYLILNGVLYSLVTNLWREIPGLYGDQSVMLMLEDMKISGVMWRLMTFVMIALVWPIVEELVYRWLITDALMQRRRRWWVAGAAFIFAFIHLEFGVFWNLFILALILGVVYYKTWSMRYSFLFHLMINAMWLLALRVQQSYGVELGI